MKLLKLVLTAVFVVGLLWMLSRVDLKAVMLLMANSNILFLFLAIFSMFLSVFFKIFRLRLVVNYYKHKITMMNATFVQMASVALAMMTPGRIGEASKIYFLNKNKVAIGKGIGITILERLTDLLFLCVVSLVFSLFYFDTSILVIFLVLLLAFIILFFVLKNMKTIAKILPINEKLKKEMANLQFHLDLPLLGLIILATMFAWLLEAGLSWLFALSIGVNVHVLFFLGVTAISTLAALFSFLPAGIGAMDFSMLFLYTLAGISAEAAASILLITRLFGTVMPITISLLFLHFKNVNLKSVNFK